LDMRAGEADEKPSVHQPFSGANDLDSRSLPRKTHSMAGQINRAGEKPCNFPMIQPVGFT
jgi:hypothetical protein